jgi:3-oxoacyl-[acyl-carrier-protein] synthase-1
MVSTLGGVISAAAAMRAGITRPGSLAFQQVLDEGAVAEKLTGHPIRHVTDGYYFIGRWCRLAHAALRDLERYSPMVELTDAATWRDTGLLLVVGDALEERYTVRDAVDDEYLQSRYVSRLTRLLRWPVPTRQVRLVRRGRCGGAEALRLASHGIEQGEYRRAIIVAADSFVEPTSLEWLLRRGELALLGYPVGISAGEAGAAVLVESEASARQRRARVEAVLESVQLEVSESDEPGAGELGRALSTAVDRALRASGTPLPFDGDIFCDLNGTEACAFDFGLMLACLGQQRIGPDVQWHSPCAFLGDAGAATGVVALCMGVRALVRGYARVHRVLTTNRDPGGVVSVALLGDTEARAGESHE